MAKKQIFDDWHSYRVISYCRGTGKISIGVDIGHTYIKLAKLQKTTEGFELLDYLDVPLSAPASFTDNGFRLILKSSLEKFCADTNKYQIWSAISSAEVEIRCITIPKVPRKQVANAVFWTFTKKVNFNQKSELLDYEILGDTTEDGAKKTEVMAFKAPKEDVTQLRAAFREIGYPLNGITIVPFAVQNLFRTQIFPIQDQNVCSLFVGRDWSRIAIFNNGNLILSRGIKAGMRSMVESINIAMRRQDDWEVQADNGVSDDSAHDEPYQTTTIDPAAQRLFFNFLKNPESQQGADARRSEHDPQQVFQMVLPAVERLLRQIERTLDHYALNYKREKVRRVYISGQVTANERLVQYIGQQLDLPIEILDPFPASHSFTEKVRIPTEASQRESFAPAIGIALSRNSFTPNFLFTHQSKDETENIRKNNMRVLTACMLCLIGMIGYFSWQERRLDTKRLAIEKINAQLLAYNPPAKKDLILGLYARTKNKRQMLGRITKRYAAVALIDELSRLTPAAVRLLTVDMRLDAQSGSGRQVILEGIIFSEPNGFETALTSYLFGLKNSPLFSKPNVISKRTEFYNTQEVLWFSARLELA
ncbi:MAG: pilus assembly protein PilM [Desulfosarcinaceae bacterium]